MYPSLNNAKKCLRVCRRKFSVCTSRISIPSQRSTGIICNCIFIRYFHIYISAMRYFTIRLFARIHVSHRPEIFRHLVVSTVAAARQWSPLSNYRMVVDTSVRPSVYSTRLWSGTCLTAPVPAIPCIQFAKLPTCLPSSSACSSAYLLCLSTYAIQSVY